MTDQPIHPNIDDPYNTISDLLATIDRGYDHLHHLPDGQLSPDDQALLNHMQSAPFVPGGKDNHSGPNHPPMSTFTEARRNLKKAIDRLKELRKRGADQALIDEAIAVHAEAKRIRLAETGRTPKPVADNVQLRPLPEPPYQFEA